MNVHDMIPTLQMYLSDCTFVRSIKVPCVRLVILKESERHHSIGSPMNGAHPSPKTDRDHLMKDNLCGLCLLTKIINITGIANARMK